MLFVSSVSLCVCVGRCMMCWYVGLCSVGVAVVYGVFVGVCVCVCV